MTNIEKNTPVESENSMTNEEESIVSSKSVFALSSDYGTTADVPSSMNSDGFGGWYVPVLGNKKGVTTRVPRFAQMNSNPCVAYTIMMGLYYLLNRNNAVVPTSQNASDWFKAKVSDYYTSSDGATDEAMKLVTIMEYSLATMKSQLDSGRPVAVTGRDSRYPHMALAVAYIGNGSRTDQYAVVDPLYKYTNSDIKVAFPTTFADFKNSYPYNASGWLKDSNGNSPTNPMGIFSKY